MTNTIPRYRHRTLGYEVEAEAFDHTAFGAFGHDPKMKPITHVTHPCHECGRGPDSHIRYLDEYHGFVACHGDYIARVVGGDPWLMRIKPETFAELYEKDGARKG